MESNLLFLHKNIEKGAKMHVMWQVRRIHTVLVTDNKGNLSKRHICLLIKKHFGYYRILSKIIKFRDYLLRGRSNSPMSCTLAV